MIISSLSQAIDFAAFEKSELLEAHCFGLEINSSILSKISPGEGYVEINIAPEKIIPTKTNKFYMILLVFVGLIFSGRGVRRDKYRTRENQPHKNQQNHIEFFIQ